MRLQWRLWWRRRGVLWEGLVLLELVPRLASGWQFSHKWKRSYCCRFISISLGPFLAKQTDHYLFRQFCNCRCLEQRYMSEWYNYEMYPKLVLALGHLQFSLNSSPSARYFEHRCRQRKSPRNAWSSWDLVAFYRWVPSPFAHVP